MNENLWNFAILNVNFILNRIIPNDSNLCSIEKLFKLKPFLDHVRIFGSKCNFLIHKSFRKKLELNTKEGILIGFDEYSGNYRILTLDLQVITARDVIVDETTTLLQFTKNFNELSIRNTSRNVQCTSLFSPLPVVNSQPITVPHDTSSISNLRSRNPICYKEARAYHKSNQFCIAKQEEDDSPSFGNALQDPDQRHWQKAIQEEVDSLQKQQTWTVTDLTINAHTIGSRFVLKAKRDENGRISRYKARLVAQGFTQIPGIDFQDTFAPVTDLATILTVIVILTHLKYQIHQMDFNSAYLNATLSENIYICVHR